MVGVAASATSINSISIYLKIASGSPPIAFENVMVHWVYQTADEMLSYGDGAASETADTYAVELVKGVSPFAADWGTRHIIGQGDMVKVTITNIANGGYQRGEPEDSNDRDHASYGTAMPGPDHDSGDLRGFDHRRPCVSIRW